MKKPFLALIPLSAMMILTGCGSSTYTVPDPKPTEPEAFKPSVVPEEIMLNSYSQTLYVGEEFQIEALLTPLMSEGSELVYSSSNTSVASVSESGLVKALAAGSSNITVKAAEEESVMNTLKVTVFEALPKTDKNLQLKFAKMKAYQKANVGEPNKLKNQQVKTYSLYKNDVLYSKSTQYNNIAFSEDDALVYFGGRDTYQRITEGTKTRDFGVYNIQTDKDYHSFIYHNSDSANRYCYVPTEFNLGTEYSRMDTVYSILDSLFSSGRDLVLNVVEDSLSTEWFDRSPSGSQMFVDGAFKDETDLVCSYRQSFKDKSTPLMEQNLDIPAYIEYEENDYFRIYWYKGEVQSYYVNFTLTYYVNGVKHKLDVQERDTFFRGSAANIETPDKSKFNLVDDIFDL